MLKKVLVSCSLAAAALHAAAGTVSFAPSDDTMVYSGAWNVLGHQGNYNFGKHQGLYVGNNSSNLSRYRSLLRFDLTAAGIDAASVTGAVLRLAVSNVDKVDKTGAGVPVGAYCISADNAAWEEGSRQASFASEGEMCWAALARNRTPWLGELGIGTNGLGVACRAGGTTVPASASPGDVAEIEISAPGAVAVLREWAGGGTNAGFLLAADDEAARVKNAVAFASRENTSHAAPELVVRCLSGDVVLASSADAFILAGNAGSAWSNTSYADWNYGRRGVMVAGTLPLNGTNQPSRSLMRFDTSSAAGACVTGAVLRLTSHDDMASSSVDPLTLRLKLVDDADADWRETANPAATAGGQQAIDGDCTWNWLARNVAPWSGGIPFADGAEVASASIPSLAAVREGDTLEFRISSLAGLRAVQRWCDGGVNAGFALVSDETVPSDGLRHAFNACSKETVGDGCEGKWPRLELATVPGNAVYADFEPSADGFYYGGSEAQRQYNWGSLAQICIGLNNAKSDTYRAIMRFEGVANAYSRAHSARAASLTLTVSQIDKIGTGSFEVRLHMLADGNAGWGEGSKNNKTCAEGDGCWDYRNYPATEWLGGPGIGIDASGAGIDKTLATVAIDCAAMAVGKKIVFEISDLDALARIDAWARDEDAPNAGFWLTTDESTGRQNALRVASRKHATADWRPKLSVFAAPASSGMAVFFR